MIRILAITILILGLGLAVFAFGGKDTQTRENVAAGQSRAIFAGGCFWCMEPPFEKLDGVSDVLSGYTGGKEKDPTYKQVASGKTGHMEAVVVHYDPAKVSYEKLLDVFWRQIDPTDAGGQFVDRGSQYASAIFYLDDEQKRLALASKARLEATGRFDGPIVTPILPAGAFYTAEDYHQDYYKRNPIRYKFYRSGSGRDKFLEKAWENDLSAAVDTDASAKYARPSEEEIKRMLTPLEFEVTQREGTEPSFKNEYWDEKREGIYVDIVSGEPLFSSKEKYVSGTGWPSFFAVMAAENIVEKKDFRLVLPRTEVRSRHGDSHIGHVFRESSSPTGMRYCMNSAALRFVPKEDMEREGYGDYLKVFD